MLSYTEFTELTSLGGASISLSTRSPYREASPRETEDRIQPAPVESPPFNRENDAGFDAESPEDKEKQPVSEA